MFIGFLAALFGIGKKQKAPDPNDNIKIQEIHDTYQQDTARQLALLAGQQAQDIEDRAFQFRQSYINPFELQTQSEVPYQIAKRNYINDGLFSKGLGSFSRLAGSSGLIKNSF